MVPMTEAMISAKPRQKSPACQSPKVKDMKAPEAPVDRIAVTDACAGSVLRSVGECVFQWDIASDTLEWSDGSDILLHIAGLDPIRSNRDFSRLLLANTPANRTDIIFSGHDRDDGQGVPYSVQYALSGETLQNGADLWIEETGRWFSDGKSAKSAGRPVRAHGVMRVVNERRLVEERMDRLSRFDTLTGLLNRTMLNEAVESQFQIMAQSGTEAGFLLIGFDHFDLINSVYGYAAGDEVITNIAGQLHANLRDVDTIARFSGTRLGILLPNCNERQMMVAGHRILDLLGTSVVETSVGPIATSLSIGAVSIPRHARDMRGATVAAQQALTQSRRNRDSSLVSFRVDPVRAKRHMDSAKMAKRIVTALGDGHINLAWQPIVNAKTGETVFHEALLRLADSEGAPIAAKDFVGVAEELGLIRIVDHHALDLALATLAECPDAVFSLNVCHDTASDPLWLSKLAAAVNRDKTLPGRLIVEITESHAAESMEEALRFIHEVKGLGFQGGVGRFRRRLHILPQPEEPALRHHQGRRAIRAQSCVQHRKPVLHPGAGGSGGSVRRAGRGGMGRGRGHRQAAGRLGCGSAARLLLWRTGHGGAVERQHRRDENGGIHAHHAAKAGASGGLTPSSFQGAAKLVSLV